MTAFIDAADPYSYLLCSYLEELGEYYDVELDVVIATAARDQHRAAPALYDKLARTDAARLAAAFGLPFLNPGADPVGTDAINARFVRSSGDSRRLGRISAALRACWRGDVDRHSDVDRHETMDRHSDVDRHETMDRHILDNNRRLAKMGHYETATLHYAGEWYAGILRMRYLVERLDQLGLATRPGLAPRIAAVSAAKRYTLPETPPSADLPPLELFFSFRSPYSRLGLPRYLAIADAFGLEFKLRPVLPMVMRGLAVPTAKIRYILDDVSREAERHKVGFARMYDPLGAGVERLMAACFLAIDGRRDREFLAAAGDAVWHRGLDMTSDAGLRTVTDSAGLDWAAVLTAIETGDWRQPAEENRARMMAAGSWGVPTVCVGDWTCWGQDRDFLLVRRLQDLAQTKAAASLAAAGNCRHHAPP